MKTMKKALVLLLSLALTVGLLGVTASAADPESVVISLVAEEFGAVEGSDYGVTLNVSEPDIGGAQGVVNYDPALFAFENVAMTGGFAEANYIQENHAETINVDEEAGTINFVLLSDGSSTDWVTFNFTVKEPETTETTADFTLSDVKVSNAFGSALLGDAVTTVDATDVDVFDAALSMEGASVRTTSDYYDLRFEFTVDKTFKGIETSEIARVGMILIPTNMILAGKEINKDASGESFCISGVKPQIVSAAFETLEANDDGNYTIYGNINKTATSHINREYSLRAFVELKSGSIVYSDNTVADKIENGVCSRSCKSTATKIYESYKASNAPNPEIEAFLGNASWTPENYKAVIDYCIDALLTV